MTTIKPTRVLLASALLLLGLAYVAVFAYLSLHSRNFLIAKYEQHALDTASDHRRALPLTLNLLGDDRQLLGFGWLATREGVQMIAHDASVHLLTSPPESDVVVRFAMRVITTPSRPVNRVTLSLNGQRLGSWEVSGADALFSLQAMVPQRLVADGRWHFNFHAERIHATYRPYGDNENDRQFLTLTQMTLQPAVTAAAQP